MNIYEIRINDTFIKNDSLIDSFLFECQCALFLIDILNPESFNLIKKLIDNIDMNKYPYLTKILVQNKSDLESERKISINEIKEFLDNNKSFDSLEISLKNGLNIQDLIKKINTAVNESNNELPLNIVSEAKEKKLGIMAEGTLSVILIGDSRVGKTCLLSRYFKNEFKFETTSNIGIDKDIKYVKIGNDRYKLTVWDTVGQERFRSLPKKYYQNADGVLLLFDVTLEDSFTNVSNWIKDVKDNSNNESNIIIYVIGNKIDKPDRVIAKEKAEEFVKSLGLKYFEISCMMNMNIQEVMARMVMECHMKANNISSNFKLQKQVKLNDNRSRGCC